MLYNHGTTISRQKCYRLITVGVDLIDEINITISTQSAQPAHSVQFVGYLGLQRKSEVYSRMFETNPDDLFIVHKKNVQHCKIVIYNSIAEPVFKEMLMECAYINVRNLNVDMQ